MSRTDVTIHTKDGDCRAFVFKPEGAGPWPAVIMYMDALAIRPTMFDMAQRLASHGYYVLLPDTFYRDGPYEAVPPAQLFATEESRNKVFAKIGKAIDADNAKVDAEAFLEFLSNQPEVKGSKVGVTGYCMGGRLALAAAANFPDRVAAAGSFHPGSVATEADPGSPHHAAGKMRAKVYVGGADNDGFFTAEDKERLDKALSAAGVDHRVEIYPGSVHGYTMKDAPAYNEDAAERHWRETFALFDSTLK